LLRSVVALVRKPKAALPNLEVESISWKVSNRFLSWPMMISKPGYLLSKNKIQQEIFFKNESGRPVNR